VRKSQLAQFQRFCEASTASSFADYSAFHAWSTRSPERFWSLFLEWSRIVTQGASTPVLEGTGVEDARFSRTSSSLTWRTCSSDQAWTRTRARSWRSVRMVDARR
jgi:hypothetical protein